MVIVSKLNTEMSKASRRSKIVAQAVIIMIYNTASLCTAWHCTILPIIRHFNLLYKGLCPHSVFCQLFPMRRECLPQPQEKGAAVCLFSEHFVCAAEPSTSSWKTFQKGTGVVSVVFTQLQLEKQNLFIKHTAGWSAPLHLQTLCGHRP